MTELSRRRSRHTDPFPSPLFTALSWPFLCRRGSAIQYVNGWADDSFRFQPKTLSSTLLCNDKNGSQLASGCYDWDNYPAMTDAGVTNQGAGCCTDPCEVIGSGFSQFALLDPNDAKGGVQFSFQSEGSASDDPFACGNDPSPKSGGKLQIQRQTTINLYCGSAPDGRLGGIKATEISTCHYLIEVSGGGERGIVLRGHVSRGVCVPLAPRVAAGCRGCATRALTCTRPRCRARPRSHTCPRTFRP